MVGLVGGPFGSVFGWVASGTGEVGRSTGMAEVIFRRVGGDDWVIMSWVGCRDNLLFIGIF